MMKLKVAPDLAKRNKMYRFIFMPVIMLYFIYSAIKVDDGTSVAVKVIVTIAVGIFMLITDDVMHWTRVPGAEGLSVYGVFGKVRVKHYAWSEFTFVGPVRVAASGKRAERIWIICAREMPRLVDMEAGTYSIERGCVMIDDLPENREAMMPYYKGGMLLHEEEIAAIED